MKYSFKLKIALISFCVSGALLAAFGLVVFSFVYGAGIDRMDREMRTLAESLLNGGRPTQNWRNLEKSLKVIYGEQHTARIALRISDAQERLLMQSDNAPSELASLPLPQISGIPEEGSSRKEQHFSERLDANRDGRVSPEEFDGPPHEFTHFDVDKDRFISLEEFLRVHPFPGARPPPMLMGEPRFETMETSSGSWRVGVFHSSQMVFTVAMDMGSFHADINRYRTTFMLVVPLALILLGMSGWFLAGRAMRPVAIIADTAEGITAKGLDQRIPNVGNDIELERLVTVFNHMLDRLEKSYRQAVRFSADAAHELQTPLTILQGELDNAIQSSENASEEQQRYGMLLEELGNLKGVVKKLLLLAHADEGRLNLNPVPTALSELVHNVTEDLEIVAPGLEIETHIADGIIVAADAALLNQTLRNMVSNAAKYSEEKGRVIFTLEQDRQRVLFTLANTAPEIPAADRPLLFERFHRVDKARSSSGSGLGLSLAREIARAHGGDLVLNDHVDGMVSFSLSLPPPAGGGTECS